MSNFNLTKIESEQAGINMRSSRYQTLAVLYAWILVLVGVVFSVTQALTDSWRVSHVSAAFEVFLQVGACFFLIYLQIYHIIDHKKKSKRNEDVSKSSDLNTVGNPSSSDVIIVKRQSSRRHSSMTGSDAASAISLNQSENGDSGFGKSQPSGKGTSRQGSSGSHTEARHHSHSWGNDTPCTSSKPDDEHWSKQDDDEDEVEIEEQINLTGGSSIMANEVTSFYLRLGVVAFAIGNLLYLALQLENNLGVYASCHNTKAETNYEYVTHMLFVAVQTFFLFKHSKVAMRKYRVVTNFGLMHVLATNMCVWVRVLVFEVLEAMYLSHHAGIHSFPGGFAGLVADDNSSCPSHSLLHDVAPYLFPFVLEYSLIGAATMAVMYQALNTKISKDINQAIRKFLQEVKSASKHIVSPRANKDTVHLDQSEHHDDDDDSLRKSHTGVLFGLLALVAAVVSLVLYFYWEENDNLETAELTLIIFSLVNNSVILAGLIYSIRILHKFAFTEDDNNSIDHMLLLLAFAGLFLLQAFYLFTAIMNVHSEEISPIFTGLFITSAVIKLVQGFIQTVHIADGMQRYVRTTSQLHSKPARGMITYLIIANVVAWLFNTIEGKKLLQSYHDEVYGSTAWAIILNVSLPLQLFFSFHSSICLAHMWHSAYRPRDPLIDDEKNNDVTQVTPATEKEQFHEFSNESFELPDSVGTNHL